MATQSLSPMADFGLRSLITHALMALTFLGAVASAFLLQGELSTLSFVAFMNFTAGVWVCQAVHSLGNSFTDSDYRGVLRALLDYVG